MTPTVGLIADGRLMGSGGKLVTWEHRTTRPDKPGHRFRSGRRNIYTNHFDQVDAQATAQQDQQRVATPMT